MKYFWPVASFGTLLTLSSYDSSLFSVTFYIFIAYLFHKGTEKRRA
jgi:hypothetical protein